MKTLVSLVDFSDVTPKVLDYTQKLATAFECDVTLVHVVPMGPVVVDFAPPPSSTDDFMNRQRDLTALRDELTARGVNATAQLFEGPILDTVITQLKRLEPDLVVMGSHGHGALYNLLIGGATEGIIRMARWPVMVVPALEADKAMQAEKADAVARLAAMVGGPRAAL
jgi:nucleotide-binding universal stress UspA family protein